MKHILMVDDVATNLRCAAEVLKDTYEITTAKSGRQALLLLKEIVPDLILLDINMPEMNGYEVMGKMKEDPDICDIPIILLTAETDHESEVKGLKMGAMDFIRKPFDPEIMQGRIDKILQLTQQKKEFQDVSQKDGLTNLNNKRYLERMLDQIDSASKKGFLLLLDLDNFKLVGDSFGSYIGDEVLVRSARVMEEEVTSEDTVCRIGGDLFAVYLSGEYQQERVKNIARRMIAGIEFEVNDLISDACDFKLSVSIGISENPVDGNVFSELYSAADKALYYVKQSGKRGYHFYQNEKGNAKEVEDESNLIDLLQLQRLIQEKGQNSGAYRVELNSFKRIYHFVSRCMERKSQDVQLVLFTIYDNSNTESDGKAEGVMGFLEEAVSKSLRRGDVATRCGNTQYVAILMNASEENGSLVVRRIQKKFEELIYGQEIELEYEMQSVGK